MKISSTEYSPELEKESDERPLLSRIKENSLGLIALLGIDFVFLICMTLLLIFTVQKVNGEMHLFLRAMGLPLGILGFAILYDFGKYLYFLIIHKTNKAAEFIRQIPIILRDWTPFLLVDFIYENLHVLSTHLNRYDIADILYKMDIWLFRIEPTLWTQKITTPLLTDIMSLLYAPYLFYPLSLMFLLSLSNRRDKFQQVSIAVCFTFLLGFLCYVIFPAQPPRYLLEGVFTHPVHLQGSFIYDYLQGAWDSLSAIRGAAFPSLHVAVSTITLIYAYRFRNISLIYKLLWYLYIPLIVGLWFSTIYLRHHWVVDIFAGWCIAALASFLSEKTILATHRLRIKTGYSSNLLSKNFHAPL